jgi:acyl-CoA thioester hydrolase
MTKYNFFQPIDVRYGDLDAQGHVNNAKFITYFEHARTKYWRHLSLFESGQSFMDLGVILADIQITFRAPIQWENKINVGVCISRMGNKSMTVEQCIVDQEDEKVYATGEIVLVAYDYHQGKSVPIPDDWREKISAFEAQ